MKPSVSLDLQRHAVRAAAKRYRTTNPRAFGSVLRGDDAEGSDLDADYLEHMLEAASLACSDVQGLARADFEEDKRTSRRSF